MVSRALEFALEVSFGDERVFHDALVDTQKYLRKALELMSTGFVGDADQLRPANEIADLAADLAEKMDRKAISDPDELKGIAPSRRPRCSTDLL